MTKFIVETLYTCTFKIVHKLDELNEKKLSDLENRKDGEVQIIDVKLNNRKTKKINNGLGDSKVKSQTKDAPDISSAINETIVNSGKLKTPNQQDTSSINVKKFIKKP